ncbi:hypothetical protein K439DRAFT_1662117 [Ramaria rubella]|nr:hypothetical protein K439DRAFT_1662117 [Ramaria rubella]
MSFDKTNFQIRIEVVGDADARMYHDCLGKIEVNDRMLAMKAPSEAGILRIVAPHLSSILEHLADDCDCLEPIEGIHLRRIASIPPDALVLHIFDQNGGSLGEFHSNELTASVVKHVIPRSSTSSTATAQHRSQLHRLCNAWANSALPHFMEESQRSLVPVFVTRLQA